jgi:hypothetical protein
MTPRCGYGEPPAIFEASTVRCKGSHLVYILNNNLLLYREVLLDRKQKLWKDVSRETKQKKKRERVRNRPSDSHYGNRVRIFMRSLHE